MSKRQAGVQITKDGIEEREDDDYDRHGPPDPVEVASAEVLAARKIAMPKSRRKPALASEEATQPNPFTFGKPAASTSVDSTSATTPFSAFGSKANEQQSIQTGVFSNPFGALSTSNSTSSSAPKFSFGSFSQTPATVEAEAEPASYTATNTSSAITPKVSVGKPENQGGEYDLLLKRRSLNVSFRNAIKICLENDNFADLSIICQEYTQHETSLKNKLPLSESTQQSTQIYPSIESASGSRSVVSEEVETAPSSPVKKTSSFAFNASAPAFSFTPTSNESMGSSFKFGTGESAPAPPFQTLAHDSTKELSNAETESPEKLTETKSNDFTWTPDKPILFGGASKETESSAFSFNNPMTSPATQAPSTSDKPGNSGFSFGSAGTGFSFGQSNDKTKDSGAAAAAAKPSFSFGQPSAVPDKSEDAPAKSAFSFGTTPTFSFGQQSSTPTFSFSAPGKATSTAPSNGTTSVEAAPTPEPPVGNEEATDAMPEEPRTNDALIAAPGVGEEDEEQVYFAPKIKLFNFDKVENKFNDIGICLVKINVNKTTRAARIIARAEGIGSIRLNTRIQPNFSYTVENKRMVKLFAYETIKGKVGVVSYLIKFPTADAAEEFKTKADECKTNV